MKTYAIPFLIRICVQYSASPKRRVKHYFPFHSFYFNIQSRRRVTSMHAANTAAARRVYQKTAQLFTAMPSCFYFFILRLPGYSFPPASLLPGCSVRFLSDHLPLPLLSAHPHPRIRRIQPFLRTACYTRHHLG